MNKEKLRFAENIFIRKMYRTLPFGGESLLTVLALKVIYLTFNILLRLYVGTGVMIYFLLTFHAQ